MNPCYPILSLLYSIPVFGGSGVPGVRPCLRELVLRFEAWLEL